MAQALSRELITRTAVELVARDGMEALSMRRLAQELDVWPMSVYRHFRDKEDLLDAVAAGVAEGVPVAPNDGPWQERLRSVLAETRTALASQPAALRERNVFAGASLRVTNAGIGILREAGFSAQQAASIWRALFAYTLGSAGLAGGEAAERKVRTAIAGLPRDEYPALSDEVAAALADDAQFDAGFDALLRGFSDPD